MTAADRILALRPSDIRKLDDADTMKLIEDLKAAGITSIGILNGKDFDTIRRHLSGMKFWGQVRMQLSPGDPLKPKRPKPAPEPTAPTRTERARAVASTVPLEPPTEDVNAFFADFPPLKPYGE